jgi:hypothetical protein
MTKPILYRHFKDFTNFLVRVIVGVSLFGSILITILFVVWLDLPYNPVEFKGKIQVIPLTDGQNVDTVMPKVKSGEWVNLQIKYCKYMPISARVITTYQDSVVYSTPETVVNNPVGCYTSVVLTQIPIGLPPEVFTITKTFIYKPNPLREVSVSVDSEEFQLIK